MAAESTFAPPAGIDLVAQPTSNDYAAPSTNPALQLAGALAKATPEVGSFTSQLGSQLQAADAEKARTAALQSSAPSFAAAVSSGQLPAGSSPWFKQAYDQDRAEVASQEATEQLVAQSQSWEEKGFNDGGVAYQQRLTKALGDIQQQIASAPGMLAQDAAVGFAKGAQPVYEQAIQANHAYQLASVLQQKRQDSTTLFEKQIAQSYSANPNATPDQILSTLQPQIAQAKAIGFQDSDVKEMVFNSILGAAYNAATSNNDQAHNILALAGTPFMGGTPLNEIAGVDGKPYGEQMGWAGMRIDAISRDAGSNAIRLGAAKAAQDGQAAYAALQAKFGWGTEDGSASLDQMRQFAKAQGISQDAFDYAAEMMHRRMEGVIGLSGDLAKAAATSPGTNKQLIDLDTEAAERGISTGLINRARALNVQGLLTDEAYSRIIDHAQRRSDELVSQGNARLAEDRADARQARQQQQDDQKGIVNFAQLSVQGAIHAMTHPPQAPPGWKGPVLPPDTSWSNPRNVAQFRSDILGVAAQGILAGDPPAKIQASIHDAIAAKMTERRNRLLRPGSGGGGSPALAAPSSSNPIAGAQ